MSIVFKHIVFQHCKAEINKEFCMLDFVDTWTLHSTHPQDEQCNSSSHKNAACEGALQRYWCQSRGKAKLLVCVILSETVGSRFVNRQAVASSFTSHSSQGGLKIGRFEHSQ